MANPLSSYLSDHLAGAKFAIELLEDMRDGHRSESLTNFAAKMLTDVAADAAVLQELSELAGGGSVLKKAGALLAEWAAQLKFRFGTDAELGNFEALEVLSLGILGKLKLWTALAEIAPFDNRLNGLDLPKLIQRAKTQHDEVEVYRLAAATKALKQFHSAPS